MHFFAKGMTGGNSIGAAGWRSLVLGCLLGATLMAGTAGAAPLPLDDSPEHPDEATPHDGLGGLDDQLDVVKALARIAPIHREVLVLFYFDDMPTAQMAEALDVAPGTVLSRLSRAREALKAVLSPAAVPETAAAAAMGRPRLRKV